MKVNTRSWSGVLPVAVALEGHTFSCRYDCSFCPNECTDLGAKKTIARSYLSSEGTFIRGIMANFGAYAQIIRRLLELESMGHFPDKLEVIILGGTFSCYDKEYRQEFVRDIFYACNIYRMFSAHFSRELFEQVTVPWLLKKPFLNKLSLDDGFFNVRKPYEIQHEHTLNTRSEGVRIVGLVVETRPDLIGLSAITELRRLGCTRVQIGIQHTDNDILDFNHRGHGSKASIIAIQKLKDNGFKVDGHIMPDLPFSNLILDYEMSREFFCSRNYQCDYVKIYPCLDLPFTKAREWKLDGIWKPYAESDYTAFLEYLAYTCTLIPPWTRVNRIHRDFPKSSVKNMKLGYQSETVETNLNQFVQDLLKKTGRKCIDIRSREVKNQIVSNLDESYLFIRNYRQANGTEYFISIEKMLEGDDAFDNTMLLGFARLRVLDQNTKTGHCVSSLRSTTIGRLRELHVYGFISNTTSKFSIQHRGLGKFLMKIVETLAIQKGCKEIAVISGVGVRCYYERLGYHTKDTDDCKYLFKKLPSHVPFYIMGLNGCMFFPYLLRWLHLRKEKTYKFSNSIIGTGCRYHPVILPCNFSCALFLFVFLIFIKLMVNIIVTTRVYKH